MFDSLLNTPLVTGIILCSLDKKELNFLLYSETLMTIITVITMKMNK